MEQYQIVASFDRDICSLCAQLDGKVFHMSDYQVGITAPPFHPWCRCCTAPWFEDMAGFGERYARDAVTGERYKVPSDMTFAEWKAQQDAFHGDGAVDKMRRMSRSTTADKKQLARYQEVFGRKGDFRGLDAFQNLKYNDTEKWESYKAIARNKNHLQQKLNYVLDGEKQFIPQYTRFEKVTTIAGAGTDNPIRDVKRLIETYGGSEGKWQKKAGKVISDKYTFDLVCFSETTTPG